MHEIFSGVQQATRLLAGDAETWRIIRLSLVVSGGSVGIAALLGVPLGAFVALKSFPGRRFVIALLNVGMGLPPVVIGLLVYVFLSRTGPLGFLGLLFSPAAMMIAQVAIVTPLIAALTLSAISEQDRAAELTARSLGAAGMQVVWTILNEARFAMGAAVIAGFGRAISEVGAVMLVGGNIAHHTRVMTTAIVLETRQGEFDIAIALGLVLLSISLLINFALTYLQQGRRPA